MTLKITWTIITLLFCNVVLSQTAGSSDIGQVRFMSRVAPIDAYKEQDFLTLFELREKNDLNMGIFLKNSLTNYLHLLAPELSANDLTERGNYQFSFYVDSTLVYTENLHPGAGTPESKNTRTAFRIPLISAAGEDSWGRFLWNRFLAHGGEEALSAGPHVLNIEIRPYVKVQTVRTGDLIAAGQLNILVIKPKADEKSIMIQSIQPGSGWELSADHYDTNKIRALNTGIAENTFKNITSIVVIKDGRLLIEEYFNGAARNTLHDTRSVGKSFASALTGIAIKDGYIKNVREKLGEFYDLKQFGNYTSRKDSVTLESLLTMSAAFNGSDMDDQSPGHEEKMYATDNWVKFALDLPMDSNRITGRDWAYFTAGVVLLGDILNRSVPGGLETYAHKKLMQPLGIESYRWQYTPQKTVNTAGSLQMRSLDYAAFGQLYKNGGSRNGRQIIPEDWVKLSLTKHMAISESPGDHYGYLFWNKSYNVNGRPYETFYSSGNGGNRIFIFKDLPLVVVITATAYNTSYGNIQPDKIMAGYILPAVAR